MTSGVYAIWRNGAEQCYIGSSQDVTQRWGNHRRLLRQNKSHSPYLQNSWNKYGEAACAFAMLEECPISILLEREQYFIDSLHPVFNSSLLAAAPARGLRRTAEQRARLSAAAKIRGVPASTIEASAAARRGRPLSEATRAKLRGRVQSPEERARRSATNLARLRNGGARGGSPLGRPVSAETRDKIAAAQRGRTVPLEMRLRIAAALTGRTHTLSDTAKALIGAKVHAAWLRKQIATVADDGECAVHQAPPTSQEPNGHLF
jgi:group I intron endonuclease